MSEIGTGWIQYLQHPLVLVAFCVFLLYKYMRSHEKNKKNKYIFYLMILVVAAAGLYFYNNQEKTNIKATLPSSSEKSRDGSPIIINGPVKDSKVIVNSGSGNQVIDGKDKK